MIGEQKDPDSNDADGRPAAKKKDTGKLARDPAGTTGWTSKKCETVSIDDTIKDMGRTSTYLVLFSNLIKDIRPTDD